MQDLLDLVINVMDLILKLLHFLFNIDDLLRRGLHLTNLLLDNSLDISLSLLNLGLKVSDATLPLLLPLLVLQLMNLRLVLEVDLFEHVKVLEVGFLLEILEVHAL